MTVQTPPYRMHTQLPRHRHPGKHLVAFVAVPVVVLAVASALWGLLREPCSSWSAAQCVQAGSLSLGGADVALLATFAAAGLAAIVEVVAD